MQKAGSVTSGGPQDLVLSPRRTGDVLVCLAVCLEERAELRQNQTKMRARTRVGTVSRYILTSIDLVS